MGLDVISLGEILVDLPCCGTSSQGNPLFEACPGGAVGNALSMLSRLGRKTALICKVGKDGFGRMLKTALTEQGIDASYVAEDDVIPTTLALVHKLPNGDRDFSFYRSPGADVMLSEDDVPEEAFRGAKIFHIGTLALTDEPAISATMKGLRLAEKYGLIVTLDPNLRLPLWKSEEDARRAFDLVMARADVMKISDNEILWYTGESDVEKGIKRIRKQFPNIRLLLASLGRDGSSAYLDDAEAFVPAFLTDKTIDTTGAGDCFCACCVDAVLEYGLDSFTPGRLKQMLTFANAAASIVTTRFGALRSMPTREEVLALL